MIWSCITSCVQKYRKKIKVMDDKITLMCICPFIADSSRQIRQSSISVSDISSSCPFEEKVFY